MEYYSIFVIAVTGLVAGVLGGMLGLGGAIVIVPAFVMLLGYSQQQAQGTTLLMMVMPVGALAAWQYYKEGFVNVQAALILGIAFFVGGYFGARVATHLPQVFLKRAFAALLIVLAARIAWSAKN